MTLEIAVYYLIYTLSFKKWHSIRNQSRKRDTWNVTNGRYTSTCFKRLIKNRIAVFSVEKRITLGKRYLRAIKERSLLYGAMQSASFRTARKTHVKWSNWNVYFLVLFRMFIYVSGLFYTKSFYNIYNTYQFKYKIVQHKFLRPVAEEKEDPIMVTCHNHDHIPTIYINLTTLEYRRKVFDVSFVRKTLYGPITYSDIIEKFKVNVPSKNIRHSELLRVEYHRTVKISLYDYFSRFSHMISSTCQWCTSTDSFVQPSRLLKHNNNLLYRIKSFFYY